MVGSDELNGEFELEMLKQRIQRVVSLEPVSTTKYSHRCSVTLLSVVSHTLKMQIVDVQMFSKSL